MANPRRIAFFGGTFDPIHEGHLGIASQAVSHLGLDQVIFLPCRRSPHKSKSPGATDSDRLAMLRLATEDLHWAVVDDYELKKPPPSYTWETVRHFKEHLFSEYRLFLLIGNDQWEALPRWQHPEKLAEDLEFIVVGRDEQPTPRPGYQAHFLEGHHPASASQIREDLHHKKTPRWLSRPVLDYILQKDLYSAIP